MPRKPSTSFHPDNLPTVDGNCPLCGRAPAAGYFNARAGEVCVHRCHAEHAFSSSTYGIAYWAGRKRCGYPGLRRKKHVLGVA